MASRRIRGSPCEAFKLKGMLGAAGDIWLAHTGTVAFTESHSGTSLACWITFVLPQGKAVAPLLVEM